MRFRPANIRVINRRNSHLDRNLRCLLRKKKEKNKKVLDWSFHIRTVDWGPRHTAPRMTLLFGGWIVLQKLLHGLVDVLLLFFGLGFGINRLASDTSPNQRFLC
jgi:hypothetical protein